MWIIVTFAFVMLFIAVAASKQAEKDQTPANAKPIQNQPVTNTIETSDESDENDSDDSLDFVVVDFETATPDWASACEVGVCVVEQGEIKTSKSWLIQPPSNEYYSKNISIHGITPDMTADALEFPEVWDEVMEFIGDKTVVAHNASFDMGVLKAECELYGKNDVWFRYICSLKAAKAIFPGLESYKLDELCKIFSIDASGHHRAENDAVMTAKMFLALCDRARCHNLFILIIMYGLDHPLFPVDVNIKSKRAFHASSKGVDTFLKNIQTSSEKIVSDNVFCNKTVVFTGKMNIERIELLDMVFKVGGIPVDNIKKSVNYVVVADVDFPSYQKGFDVSGKVKKAKEWIAKGVDMKIISETEFLSLYNGSEKQQK